MIITRTPFRVSFLGGGTDIPWFYETGAGAVISTSINRYMYLSGHPMFDSGEILLKYSKTERVSDASSIEHPIAREVLTMEQLNGVDISVNADFPAGSGLGSSSAFTVGLALLAAKLKGRQPSQAEIARTACHVEIERLGEPIGKQDQYASAYGGLNELQFQPNGNVDVLPVVLDDDAQSWLSRSMVLVRVNQSTRSASAILEKQRTEVLLDTAKMDSMRNLYELTKEAIIAIRSDISVLPEFVNEGWRLKKIGSSGSTTDEIDELITFGLSAGARGAKMLGAGASGFVLFLVDPETRDQFADKFSHRVELVAPEGDGAVVIYSDVE